MTDLEILNGQVFAWTREKRLDDVRETLCFVIAATPSAHQEMVARVAAEIFEHALRQLLPLSWESEPPPIEGGRP